MGLGLVAGVLPNVIKVESNLPKTHERVKIILLIHRLDAAALVSYVLKNMEKTRKGIWDRAQQEKNEESTIRFDGSREISTVDCITIAGTRP